MIYNIYIINDKVIFKVNEEVLEPLSKDGERVILNSPTARCLQLLLESNREIVSRDQFLEAVWGTRGIVVSENTFYQNISLLRKSLKTAGLEKDIITTVRRQGFGLSSDTSILPVSETSLIAEEYCQHSDSNNQGSDLKINKNHAIDLANNASMQKRTIVYSVPTWIIALIVLLIAVEIISLLVRHFL